MGALKEPWLKVLRLSCISFDVAKISTLESWVRVLTR